MVSGIGGGFCNLVGSHFKQWNELEDDNHRSGHYRVSKSRFLVCSYMLVSLKPVRHIVIVN